MVSDLHPPALIGARSARRAPPPVNILNPALWPSREHYRISIKARQVLHGNISKIPKPKIRFCLALRRFMWYIFVTVYRAAGMVSVGPL